MYGWRLAVTRRIRMEIEAWDRQPLREQEQTIGRTKAAGARLGQQAEFDPVDVTKRVHGQLAIPPTSRVLSSCWPGSCWPRPRARPEAPPT